MTYQEALEWLYSTQGFGIKLGLEGSARLLGEYLAYPAHGVKVIHVAGTNGKGSTCAMIDSLARSCGMRTGLFTSPHLIDFRERVKVSSREIAEEDCVRGLTKLREICQSLDPHPTFFEISLALAMRYFREKECELIVLETGMGGRLDATTAVPADVCVITPIGMDHAQWLGETLEEIAYEKACIIAPGKPVVVAPQEAAAMGVIHKVANVRRSPLEVVDQPLLGYHIALAGEHQRWNAALATAALHQAGVRLNTETVAHGLARVDWPGRFERIAPDVVLDGAHNPHAARALAETWKTEYGGHKAVLIFGAASDKDVAGVLEILAPLADAIHLCQVNNPRAAKPEEIAKLLPAGSPTATLHLRFEDALAAARQRSGPILVTGSLFLVGEAHACFEGTRTYQPSLQ